jgi:zinc/manganese transport system substrate-binding protein
MKLTHRLWTVLTSVALVGLAGCSSGGGAAPAETGLRVVATTTQVGSLAAEIGADAIGLTVLLEPGIESHDFELTPAAGAALEGADLILISGAGLEGWLDESLETIGNADRVRDMSGGVTLRLPGDAEPLHAEGAEDDHDEGDGHDAVDPHYWLSAPNAVRMAENVRDALAEAAPAEADGFAARAEAVIDRIGAADAEVRAIIAEIDPDRRKIVTDHDALGYFIDEYGLEFVGSVFPSLDVASEPSARDIETLVGAIRAAGVTAVFTETSVDPRLAAAVADETDARLVDKPIYTDSLGPTGSGADTIDGMLVHNARVIRDGLIGG